MDERVIFLRDFVKYLRYNRKERLAVNKIMKSTGLSRVTLLELEKMERNSITPYIYESFKSGYEEEFTNFEKEWKDNKISDENTENELALLIKTNSQLAKAYSSIVDNYIELQKTYKEILRKWEECEKRKLARS